MPAALLSRCRGMFTPRDISGMAIVGFAGERLADRTFYAIA